VSRLGGDEFALLLPPSTTPGRSAMQVAQSIRESLSRPIVLSDVTISTEASVGIAVAQDGESHTDLLRHADTAMYAAKASGLPWEIYEAALDRGRTERLALLSDLRQAIENDELHLHYQPKLDLRSGLITSVEALVRWTHPTLGSLGPDVFIPLAESTGLIEQLTAVVLEQALRQCRLWETQGLNLAVAVNLSARNVNNPALPDQVAAALDRAGVAAAHLILEITESAVMGDPERTVPTLNRLVDLGVTLSLDDFGTGYSSLAYLQRLPVREVKIDRSFVLGMSHPVDGRASTALVRSIISLGQSLGLRIVAEGVETQEAVDLLEGLGCHVVQGYHVGRPVPGHDIVPHHHARLGDSVREGVRNSRHPHRGTT
jgi:predicted signal transduction protein with EAL and GGDEF domain